MMLLKLLHAALLEEKRDAVGETNDAGGIFGGEFAAEGSVAGFDLEWVAAIDFGFAAARRRRTRLVDAFGACRPGFVAHADGGEAIRLAARRRASLKLLEEFFDLMGFRDRRL